MFYVYKIKNNINNLVYIGSTDNFNERWRNHKYCAFNKKDHHYNYPLMKAFREFGVDNFTFSVIEVLDRIDEMKIKEREWIEKENCIFPNGYNQTFNTDTPMFDKNISKKMSNTKRNIYGKIVCEINDKNEILNIYNSIAEAEEKTGLNRFKISAVCNGKRITTGNKKFRFLENNKIIEPVLNVNLVSFNRITKSSKKILRIDNMNNIKRYDSIILAAQDNNCDASGISKVCNGKRKTCGGYNWKYE